MISLMWLYLVISTCLKSLPFQIRFAFILEFVNSFRLVWFRRHQQYYWTLVFRQIPLQNTFKLISLHSGREVPTVAINKQIISFYKYRELHRSVITYRQQLFVAFSFSSVQVGFNNDYTRGIPPVASHVASFAQTQKKLNCGSHIPLG